MSPTPKWSKRGFFSKVSAPDHVVALIRGLHPLLKKRIKAALNKISHDPNCGKALKDDLSGLQSFRIKRFRIIYKVKINKQINIVAIGPRKFIYEETFRIISTHQKQKG